MPRGRPRKNKGITVKSKETQIFLGFVLLSLGIGIALSSSVNSAIPNFIYKLLGVNQYLVGLFIALIGFKLLGLKHHITSTKMTWGLILLFFISSIFLGYLWVNFAHLYYPGLIGINLHNFLYDYLGIYIEMFLLIPLFTLSLALIANVEYEQLAEFIKNTTSYILDSLIFTFNILVKTAKFVINSIKKLWHKITNKFTQKTDQNLQQSLEQTSTFDSLNSNPFIPEQELQTVNTQNSQINTLAQDMSNDNLTQDNDMTNHATHTTTNLTKTTTESLNKTTEPDINIQFKAPLYTSKKTKQTNNTTTTQSQAQEEVVQISPVLQRFINIYTKHTVSVNPPPLTIFDKPLKDEVDLNEIRETSQKIEQALASFKVQAKVTKFFVGPSVIQYALNLATGTKVAKVENLAKDIALAIAAPNGSIRIDTIAGTNLIGIEVPRKKQHLVRISEILSDKTFIDSPYVLPLAIGKNVQAKSIILDLADMPHMLVAGATGTGKSVALNTIIASLLIRFKPDNLRLILVDPKQVEMEPYNGIPHLVTPVITNMDQVVGVLEWLIMEMEQRYLLFKETGVRNLKEYNAYAKKQHQQELPYLVLIIDEMADLILTKRNEVENKIVRLAQLARATGIHLILATQRPSVNVITGLIKANIPARIALAVASQVDSRVIIDQAGAENLIGKGDMLIKTPNTPKPHRVQGAFISTQEVQRLTNYLRNKAREISENTTQMYIEEVLNYMQTGGKPKPNLDSIRSGGLSQLASLDEYLPKAVEIVLQTRKASASSLQRYLKIGFNRAARLIDYMEELGIISQPIGNKREVLINSLDELG